MLYKNTTFIATIALLLPTLSYAQSSDATLSRAQVRAELVQLEKAGYQPAADDMEYPHDLRAAERRARQNTPRDPVISARGNDASQL